MRGLKNEVGCIFHGKYEGASHILAKWLLNKYLTISKSFLQLIEGLMRGIQNQPIRLDPNQQRKCEMALLNNRIFKPSLGARLGRLVVKTFLAPKFTDRATVEETRKAMETMARMAWLPRGTRSEKIQLGDLPAEWVRAKNVPANCPKAILYIHGGGFIAGSPATHRELAARISKAAAAPVLLPDYRLAPEHQYPAANEDCLASYQWLIDQGFRASDISIGGDSAGGCLVLMTLLRLRDQGSLLPASAFFLSPLTDAIHRDGESRTTRADVDPFFLPGNKTNHAAHYIGNANEPPSILSPLRQNLSGLCPLLIQVGEDEILLSDSERLAQTAQKDGCQVQLEVYPHMWHVFQAFGTIVPEARDAIASIGEFLKKTL